jgi:hypothetical protein
MSTSAEVTPAETCVIYRYRHVQLALYHPDGKSDINFYFIAMVAVAKYFGIWKRRIQL